MRYLPVLVLISVACVAESDEAGDSDLSVSSGPTTGESSTDEEGAGSFTGGNSAEAGGDCEGQFDAQVVEWCNAQFPEPPQDGSCHYGGMTKSDCVTNFLGELDTACTEDCTEQASTWMTCLVGAAPICGSSGADTACGIERGLLENCCFSCGSVGL